MISGKKILVTGASGRIASALSLKLAEANEVWGIARFGNEEVRRELEAAGVKTRVVDLTDPDFSRLPEDFDHVLHLAAHLVNDWDFDRALDVNAVGTGLLLSHFRHVASALVMSTTGVYRPNADPWHQYTETDPLGDPINPSIPTYGVTKVAEEGVARLCARLYDLPVVIGRMNASYGPRGGLPVTHLGKVVAGETIRLRHDPAPYSPIHDDDIAEHIEALLGAADVSTTVVNFGGDHVVSAQEWCAYFGELSGREPIIEVVPVPGSQPGIALDVSKRIAITGPDRIHWRDGLAAVYESRFAKLQ